MSSTLKSGEKLKTFNLKQIVTRNGTVLMNMLERLLETTEIDARDVETECPDEKRMVKASTGAAGRGGEKMHIVSRK